MKTILFLLLLIIPLFSFSQNYKVERDLLTNYFEAVKIHNSHRLADCLCLSIEQYFSHRNTNSIDLQVEFFNYWYVQNSDNIGFTCKNDSTPLIKIIFINDKEAVCQCLYYLDTKTHNLPKKITLKFFFNNGDEKGCISSVLQWIGW